eukprot:CAMPEP_0168861472 /NCGR_PEP_ID=MMETSP0727-20121128/17936_1 /TAXON_ID=265536 /ORGANISM="Amphiprora sp., Strain CCMP467" /LENGTH=106 /DNA_ID=CAMNT_0008916479 /DNA_START=40 /DNA_END=356 /DNA_ORIENTATION=-
MNSEWSAYHEDRLRRQEGRWFSDNEGVDTGCRGILLLVWRSSNSLRLAVLPLLLLLLLAKGDLLLYRLLLMRRLPDRDDGARKIRCAPADPSFSELVLLLLRAASR